MEADAGTSFEPRHLLPSWCCRKQKQRTVARQAEKGRRAVCRRTDGGPTHNFIVTLDGAAFRGAWRTASASTIGFAEQTASKLSMDQRPVPSEYGARRAALDCLVLRSTSRRSFKTEMDVGAVGSATTSAHAGTQQPCKCRSSYVQCVISGSRALPCLVGTTGGCSVPSRWWPCLAGMRSCCAESSGRSASAGHRLYAWFGRRPRRGRTRFVVAVPKTGRPARRRRNIPGSPPRPSSDPSGSSATC